MSWLMLETAWRWLLCTVSVGVILPLSIVILFKAELKNLLYLKFKQYLIVKIDSTSPDSINNYNLVAAHGKVSTEGDLHDQLTGFCVSETIRIFRQV